MRPRKPDRPIVHSEQPSWDEFYREAFAALVPNLNAAAETLQRTVQAIVNTSPATPEEQEVLQDVAVRCQSLSEQLQIVVTVLHTYTDTEQYITDLLRNGRLPYLLTTLYTLSSLQAYQTQIFNFYFRQEYAQKFQTEFQNAMVYLSRVVEPARRLFSFLPETARALLDQDQLQERLQVEMLQFKIQQIARTLPAHPRFESPEPGQADVLTVRPETSQTPEPTPPALTRTEPIRELIARGRACVAATPPLGFPESFLDLMDLLSTRLRGRSPQPATVIPQPPSASPTSTAAASVLDRRLNRRELGRNAVTGAAAATAAGVTHSWLADKPDLGPEVTMATLPEPEVATEERGSVHTRGVLEVPEARDWRKGELTRNFVNSMEAVWGGLNQNQVMFVDQNGHTLAILEVEDYIFPEDELTILGKSTISEPTPASRYAFPRRISEERKERLITKVLEPKTPEELDGEDDPVREKFRQEWLDKMRSALKQQYPHIDVRLDGNNGRRELPRMWSTYAILRKERADLEETDLDIVWRNATTQEVENTGMNKLEYLEHIFAQDTELPDELKRLIIGLCGHESKFDSEKVSRTDARGDLMFMSDTAHEFGLDPGVYLRVTTGGREVGSEVATNNGIPSGHYKRVKPGTKHAVYIKEFDQRYDITQSAPAALKCLRKYYQKLRTNKYLKSIQERFALSDEETRYLLCLFTINAYNTGVANIELIFQRFFERYSREQVLEDIGSNPDGSNLFAYITQHALVHRLAPDRTTRKRRKVPGYGYDSAAYVFHVLAMTNLLERRKEDPGYRVDLDESLRGEPSEFPSEFLQYLHGILTGILGPAVAGILVGGLVRTALETHRVSTGDGMKIHIDLNRRKFLGGLIASAIGVPVGILFARWLELRRIGEVPTHAQTRLRENIFKSGNKYNPDKDLLCFVDLKTDRLILHEKGKENRIFPLAIALAGVGYELYSNRTPEGSFRLTKPGEGNGESQIMIEGLEERNSNSRVRLLRLMAVPEDMLGHPADTGGHIGASAQLVAHLTAKLKAGGSIFMETYTDGEQEPLSVLCEDSEWAEREFLAKEKGAERRQLVFHQKLQELEASGYKTSHFYQTSSSEKLPRIPVGDFIAWRDKLAADSQYRVPPLFRGETDILEAAAERRLVPLEAPELCREYRIRGLGASADPYDRYESENNHPNFIFTYPHGRELFKKRIAARFNAEVRRAMGLAEGISVRCTVNSATRPANSSVNGSEESAHSYGLALDLNSSVFSFVDDEHGTVVELRGGETGTIGAEINRHYGGDLILFLRAAFEKVLVEMHQNNEIGMNTEYVLDNRGRRTDEIHHYHIYLMDTEPFRV